MSGPPNINSGPTSGSGRGRLRTPPPTYFRSPSPWVPPRSTPIRQHLSPLHNTSETQYASQYNATPVYVVQPISSYQYVDINETQNQTPVNIRYSNNAAQNYAKIQETHGASTAHFTESHMNKGRDSTQLYQLKNTSQPKQFANVTSTIGNYDTPSSQRRQTTPQMFPPDSSMQRPHSRGPNIRQNVPSYQYQTNFEQSLSIETDHKPQYVIYDCTGEAGPSTAEIIANQSQDYVDEKLAEYQATIYLLQDEQERVQKKTFVNWINSFLTKRNPPLKIVDLIQDLKDGTKLLALLELLSGQRLPVEKGKVLRRPHYLSNVNTALQFLTSKRIKLVNINPSDIVDGRPAVVLGLIWTIILYFQIEENSRILHYLNANLSGSVSSLDSLSTSCIQSPIKPLLQDSASNKTSQEMLKQGPRKTLLGWVNNALPKQSGLDIKDFGASWRDGYAFLTLIDAIKTNVINIADMKRCNNRHRLDTAFNVAETELGIAKLLDAEDVDVNCPDEKSIMTYVAQFLHKYPDVKNINSKSESEQELFGLLNWLQSIVCYYDNLNGNYPNKYELYEKLNLEKLEKHNLYKKVKNIHAGKLTPEVQDLNDFWQRLEVHLQQWLWFLDCSLPEQFAVIGLWLSNGEKLLIDSDIPSNMNEETASLISKKLEAHKQFFAAYPEVYGTFNDLKVSSIALKVPENQLANIEKRLFDIDTNAKQRRIKLKFLEHKCCLIAFLNLLENKINSVKYSNENTVKQSLEQLRNFVTRNQIMQEFEKALIDMRQVIEEYKVDGNIVKKEEYNIDTFLREIEDRWKNISSRLICTETMLEDVLSHWKRWRNLSDELEKWIEAAQIALNGSEDEKIEFFQNLATYKEKISLLADTYNILKSTCDYDTANKIENTYKQLLRHWDKIFQYSKQYLHVGDVLQHRQKFKTDAALLSDWIRNAEIILSMNNLKNINEIKQSEAEVKKIACEMESKEELFKSVSRSFQVLIKEYSRDEVDKMMTLMKRDKEALVCIRAQIPIKLHLFHQLLTQQEALESGRKEISEWLDEAENLLISYAFNNESQQSILNLTKHKNFFNRTLYYKSMLESKNNVFHNLLKLTNADNSVNMNDLSNKMKQLNERFAYVINNANDWEYKLQENLKAWEKFNSSQRTVENYLRQAESWLNATMPLEKQSDVRTQLDFFKNADQSTISALESNTEELLKYLPPNEQKMMILNIESLQKHWSEVISNVPQHLMKLEFRMNEIMFYSHISQIEKELNSEEQAYNCNENYESIVQRNEDFFKVNDLQNVERVLAALEKISYVHADQFSNDRALCQQYQIANNTWIEMCKRIDNVKNILNKIPAQWDAYHEKFNEMSRWMDSVDQSLKQIMIEKETMEQFEQEKITFQNICFEADARREDMKWLVKTLDFLLNHANEEQAATEQEKIEKLITRYKTLIPTIETTMVKTEIFAKCYTYRHETEEICKLLDRIKNQSENAPTPESYRNINSMIEEQNVSLKELDNQRGHIMKMLQKGKDLSKNVNAPDFVTKKTKILESSWNDTYNETAEKLRALRAVQKTWSDYIEQKGIIEKLLSTAELELRSITPLQTDPTSVTQDLEMKKQLALNLKQASSKSFLQLNDLCRELGSAIQPSAIQALEKETSDLQNRMINTTDFVDKRIDYLSDYNDKWNDYKKRLDSLRSWVGNVYPKMVAAIKQPQITSADRLQKTKQLENVLTEKIKTLDFLNASASDLASKEGNLSEMKRLKSEAQCLQVTFSELSNALSIEKANVNQDLEVWGRYNDDVSKVKDWIHEAQLPLLNKVCTLQDAVSLQSRFNELNVQCNKKFAELENLSQICKNIKYGIKPTEEVDKCYAALTDFHENTQHAKGKVDKLVKNFSAMDNELSKINFFIEGANDKMRNFSSIKSERLPIDKLDETLKLLRMFNNEISEQQAKLISLVHIFDQINNGISEQGVPLLKSKLQEPKDHLSGLSDAVRCMINEYYQHIVVQQNFNAKLTDFSNWMDQMTTSIAELEETLLDEIELALQKARYLLQQHSGKREVFNEIYSHIKNDSLTSVIGDASVLDETYSSLASNYQNIESDLQAYIHYLQSWSDFLHWYYGIKDQIQHLNDSVMQYDLVDENELKNIKNTIANHENDISIWKQKMVSLEAQPKININDSTGNKISAISLIMDLDKKLEKIKIYCDAKSTELNDIKQRVAVFQETQKQIVENLNSISDKLKCIVKNARLSNLADCIEELSVLNGSVSDEYSSKTQANYEANLLMKQEGVLLNNVQEPLVVLDKELENIQLDINETLENFVNVRDNYNDFNRYNMALNTELKNVAAVNKATVSNVSDKQSIIDRLEQLHRSSESMRKIKKHADGASNKGNDIVKAFRKYNALDCENLLEIIKQNNNTFKTHLDELIDNSNALNDKLSLFKQIEEINGDVTLWLEKTKDHFNNGIDNPSEIEHKLINYRNELPGQLLCKNNLNSLLSEFKKINNCSLPQPLETMETNIESLFSEIQTHYDKLNCKINEYAEIDRDLKDRIKIIIEKLYSIREELMNCDDVTLDVNKQIRNLEKLQTLRNVMNSVNIEITELKNDFINAEMKFDSIKESTTSRELQSLEHRFGMILNNLNEVDAKLNKAIEKTFIDKVLSINRMVSSQLEKLKWCQPEANSDKGNLEIKKSALDNIEHTQNECEANLLHLSELLSYFDGVIGQQKVDHFREEKKDADSNLSYLKSESDKIKSKINSNIALWEEYELNSGAIVKWLKEIEKKHKMETILLIELKILDDKIEETKNTYQSLMDFQINLKNLHDVANNINNLNPESRVLVLVNQLQTRFNTFEKHFSFLLNRLSDVATKNKQFRKSLKEMFDWIETMKPQLARFANSTNENHVELKSYRAQIVAQEQLINDACSIGENLYAEVNPDCRESIRMDIVALRNAYRALLDESNLILKEMEANIVNKKTSDESHGQLVKWLQELKNKFHSMPSVYANLQLKKDAVFDCKTMIKDANYHKSSVEQLQKKCASLYSTDALANIYNTCEQYNSLINSLSNKLTIYEKAVKDHEHYNSLLETSRDWLLKLKLQTNDVFNDAADLIKGKIQEYLLVVDNTLMEEEAVLDSLNDVYNQYTTVLSETDEVGHSNLLQAFEECKGNWTNFFENCRKTKSKLTNYINQIENANHDLDDWLTTLSQTKSNIRALSCQTPIDSKQNAIAELVDIKKGIEDYGLQMCNKMKEYQELKANYDIASKYNHVQTDYRNVIDLCMDAIDKTKTVINDQVDFDKAYNEFINTIMSQLSTLDNLQLLVGDLNVLQNRQIHLKEIAYKRLDDGNSLEELINRGEKLYAQTSSEDRDQIRLKLSELRKRWDEFSDKLESTSQKVDQCILQLGEFSLQQEQLSKWLKDIEMSMKSTSELKSNIQDKRSQYQNHKLMHQEILSQNALLDSVCNKAQHLLLLTNDQHLGSYLISIKDTYKNIVQKSNELLINLNDCVNAHNDYNNILNKLKIWITEEKDKITVCDDEGGEKQDIVKRIETLNNLKLGLSKGEELLNQLEKSHDINKLSTAPEGIMIAEQEITAVRSNIDDLKEYLKETTETQQKCLAIWIKFDHDLDTLTKWCRSVETIFRDQQLYDTLEQKQNQLQVYRTNLEHINDKQKDVDDFVANAQALFSKTGIEKVKFYINQLINRYQLLLVLSKEVVNRAQNIVNDHISYDERLTECRSRLLKIENNIKILAAEKNSTDNQNMMQVIDIEKEKLENYMPALVTASEKVLSETSSQGREKIRDDMKKIKDQFENIIANIGNLKNQLDVRSVQWSSYKDSIHQILSWLDITEKKLDRNETQSWNTTQEIRSKLFKYKALVQEVASQKRMIDSLNEKAAQVCENQNDDLSSTVQSINDRYDGLKKTSSDIVLNLEQSLSLLNQFNEQLKSYIDEQEDLFNELKQLSDVSGSRKSIQDKLLKVQQLQQIIPEKSRNLTYMNKLITDNNDLISHGAKITMEQDLMRVQHEFEKLNSSINDTKLELEKRIQLWSAYQNDLDDINSFLSEIEDSVRSYCLKNTLPEKQEQYELYQVLSGKLKNKQLSVDSLLDKTSELLQSSGDAKMPITMQQIKTRMQSVENTVKEIYKKCEQAYEEHKLYKTKYGESVVEMDSIVESFENCKINQENTLDDITQILKTLLAKQNAVNVHCSLVSDIGERLYTSTASTGHQVLRNEIQDLLQRYEKMFDDICSYLKMCEAKTTKLSGFNEKLDQIQRWLEEIGSSLTCEMILKPTLDDKICQQQTYIDLFSDIKNHKPEINNIQDLFNNLKLENTEINSAYAAIHKSYNELFEKCQYFVQAYEKIVYNHRQYCKIVLETSDFIDANHNTIELWGETDLDQVSLHTNLGRLHELKMSIISESNRIEQIRTLGELTIPDTSDEGKANIRLQIDISQQEWEGVLVAIDSTTEKLQSKITEWNDYEKLRSDCMNWIREVDSKIHSIDLKSSLNEKKATLDYLKSLQGEVKAKELEIDSFTEKAQMLYRGYLSSRNSQISELAVKYQQTTNRVKELATRWQQYVISHQELESQVSNCKQWLSGIREKLNFCADQSTTSEKEMQSKMKLILELIGNKDEGSLQIKLIMDLAQQVLACTTSIGHEPINSSITSLQDEWSALTLKMVDVRSNLDEAINQWSGFLDQVNELRKSIEWMENEFKAYSEYQQTMAEKRAQLDKIKNCEEKIRLERIEIEPLKQKAAEMCSLGQQTQAASTAKQILAKFDYVADQISKLLTEREDQYRDHRLYKEAFDDLLNWIHRAREKLPSVKQQSLSDKLSIDNAVAPLDSLMNKKAQGELLVEHLLHTGEVVMASTSSKGKELIKSDIDGLKNNFNELFKEISDQKRNLEKTISMLREYKEEYERLSEWLQQIDIIVKNNKLAMSSNLQEKEKQVKDMQELLGRLSKGQSEIDKFNAFATPLLHSHLDSYIGNQLRHLNSRYQVQVNIAKDVLKKVETNYDLHKDYNDYLQKANDWIENAKEIVRVSTDNVERVSKENLEKRLEKIVELIQQRDQGQNLVNNTINTGEKVVKCTKSDGKEVINNELREIQNSWDRLVKKMSTAKVHLETSLLQWADYSSSYNHLQQWIQDRESKLQRVSEQKVVRFKTGTPTSLSSGLNERRANLRQANDIVQDIVSFEPMIQSVANKASDLHQTSPASEISHKYENLSKQAKEVFAKQKETVELHQAFIDTSNEFAAWIRNAKENINKCTDYKGDKDSLISKMTQLKILENDAPVGQKKLEKALQQAEIACQIVDSGECEAIEKEVALLQEEFDNYCLALKKIGTALENGIVRWTEYDDQYKIAQKWLDNIEGEIQQYNKMQSSLEEKKYVLEEFQSKLQTLFDWQRELDNLNMKAQVLLDICADTRVSNGVTQLTTKYNVLLSIAKETMRRLEQHYQEHQQHNTLFGECHDWLDRIHEKVNECDATPQTITETQSKLNIIKGIRQNLEQGQNKLRYLFELKEKIVLSTEPNGASKIAEDTENIKADYESLMVDINENRQKLMNHLALLEDLGKLSKVLSEWIEEVHGKMNESPTPSELSDTRVALEKYRTIQRETGNYNDIAGKIKEKIAGNDSIRSEKVNQLLKDYDDVIFKLSNEIEKLENSVNNYDKFKQGLQMLYDWMKLTRLNTEKTSDYHGDKNHIIEQMNRIKEIQLSFSEGKILLENAQELGNRLLQIVNQEGHDTIKQELLQAKSDWEDIGVLTSTTYQGMMDVLSSWERFTEKIDDVTAFIEEYENKISSLNDENVVDQDDKLKQMKHIFNIIVNKKNSIEELNDMCEALMEKCACSMVRDRTVELQKKYSTLLANLQALISKLEKNVVSQTEYIYFKDEMQKWIDGAKQAISSSQYSTSDDIGNIINKINAMQSLANSIPQGQKLFEMLQDSFTKSSYMYSEDKQSDMFQTISEQRDQLDAIVTNLNVTLNDLNSKHIRLEQYEEMKRAITEWMNFTEKAYEMLPDTHGEMSELKMLLEKIKHILTEVTFKKVDLDNIQQEAAELFESNKSDIENDLIQNLHKRNDKMKERCTYGIQKLEMELNDQMMYYQTLQEIEKWLLQISFQLMAHNSLYIHNREQTMEQIEQHEKLLNEIQRYQINIDDFNVKAQSQIERYVSLSPNIKNQIENQIKNIQDSYSSLLNTSVQIKNRLYDSLHKFQEYEDTLNDITRNLDKVEPEVAQGKEISATEFMTVKKQLERAQKIHNKLQVEKSRLIHAVQACEAATASISRPSSPIDSAHQVVPENELIVRARLEDLIDEVQAWITDLIAAANDCERQQKQRCELEQWITKQNTVINDWSSKPSKFRSEAAEQELKQMSELLRNVIIKKDDLSSTEDSLAIKLDDLQAQLKKVIDKKSANQICIERYKKCYEDTQHWLDAIIGQIDNLEKGNGFSCKQRLEKAANIQKILSDNCDNLKKYKENASIVIELVSNLDAQQVNEQIKSMDRRFQDINKRLNRKFEIIDGTNKALLKIVSDVDSVRQWLNEKSDLIKTPYTLGFEAKSAEAQQQAFKNLLKEVENRQTFTDGIRKRFSSIQSDLEKHEKQPLEESLNILSDEFNALCEYVRHEIEKISDEILCRKNMQNNFEMTRTWIKSKLNDVNKISEQLPLLASNVLSEINLCKRHDVTIREFEEKAFKDFTNQVKEIMKDCNDDGQKKLLHDVNVLKKQLMELTECCSRKIEFMERERAKRLEYEGRKDQLNAWFAEVEPIALVNIRITSLDILKDQFDQIQKVMNESFATKTCLKEVDEYKNAIVPTLNDIDKNSINIQVKACYDKFNSLQNTLSTKLEKINTNISDFENALGKIKKCEELLSQVQNQIREMNKPVASKIECIQDFMMSYETILADLKEQRLELNSILLTNIPQLQENTSKLEEMIIAIEEQLRRLKTILNMKEQFIGALNDVVKTISKITTDFNEIDHFSKDIEVRIQKYDDILIQIDDCSSMLANASEKGRLIANEGTDFDRHNIMEQIHSLKIQLDTIKRNVTGDKDKNRKQQVHHNALSQEYTTLLDWFKKNIEVIESRPLFSEDLNESAELIKLHESLCVEARAKTSQLNNLAKKTQSDTRLPSNLQLQIETAERFRNIVPKELVSRGDYLLANHNYRVAYHKSLDQVNKWIEQTEHFLAKSPTFKVDIDSLNQDLFELGKLMESEAAVRNVLYHEIQEQADLFWNTLTEKDQNQCLSQLQHLKMRLTEFSDKIAMNQKEILFNKDILEQHACQRSKIVLCLQNNKLDDSMMTEPMLSARIDLVGKMLEILRTNQHELDTFNKISSTIIGKSDSIDSEPISAENLELNNRWINEASILENLQENLIQLRQQWTQLEDILQELETKSSSLLEKDNNLDSIVRSKENLQTKLSSLQNLLDDKTVLNQLNKKANSLAKTLIEALQKQKLSPHTLEEKLIHLNQIDSRLTENLKAKHRNINEKADKLQNFSNKVSSLTSCAEALLEKLKAINPFDERLYQTEQNLLSCKSKAQEYTEQSHHLNQEIREEYLTSQEFIPVDIDQQQKSLEALVFNITETMEDFNCKFQRAKEIRTNYFVVYDKIKTWIENAELAISNHNIDPSELKTKLVALIHESSEVRIAYEQLVYNGSEIIENCRDHNDRKAMQANMDQISYELSKTIQLIEEKNHTVDQILGNWANFMRVYQLVIEWSLKLKILLDRKLQLNSLQDAQLARQDYATAVSSLTDVSQNLSEMNHEFDKINEVCSTGYLKNKLHEAETLKIDIETVLFERNLYLQETTEEWLQFEHKIKSVKEWIEDSYKTLGSADLKNKPLRDQLRILEQMLADVSAQKIKVNMSLEKLQVHFHSEIIYTENLNIVHDGRVVIEQLDKLNRDVFHNTQNLDKALTQIEDCQSEMQTIRQRIVQEEQQLRNILSPLHQSSESEKNEQTLSESVENILSRCSTRKKK
ncbi:muscle-specific protein 300 kDa isoform X2 [Armigeres subalbatus]|uniref:muscle-specific protein 300 kDa isoform X2 n=1 Tax=Armigeres subalbatus TaxID=124917 RepID=UPI002ED1E268